MGFRLVPKSVKWMTLNGVMVHICVISMNSVDFRVHYVKVVKDTPILSAKKCCPKNLVLVFYHLWRYSQGITPDNGLKVKRPPAASENLTNNQP